MSTALLTDLVIFVLSLWVGFEVISKVPATLHTPLMSAANSIHGIVLVGAMLIAATTNSWIGYVIAFLAAVFATPLFGLLLDRIGRNTLLLAAGAALLPLSFLVLGVMSGAAGLSTALLGVSFSFLPAILWPSVVRYAAPEHLGTAYGLMTTLQNFGLFAANLVAGYLNDAYGASAANPGGYTPMLWFFGLLSLSAFVGTAALWLRDHGNKPVPEPSGASIQP